MSLPSRRLMLAVLGVSAALGAVTLVIVRQTTPPPPSLDAPRGPPTPEAPGPATAAPATPEAPSAGSPSAPPAEANDAAAERALALEVRALVASGQVGKARSRANAYYQRFPSGPAGAELERLTGAHPTGAAQAR